MSALRARPSLVAGTAFPSRIPLYEKRIFSLKKVRVNCFLNTTVQGLAAGSWQLCVVMPLTKLSSRAGPLRGRRRSALRPLCPGLRVTLRVRDDHRVLRGDVQPHQLLALSQVNTCQCNSLAFSMRGFYSNTPQRGKHSSLCTSGSP